ncbi:hypothetical protein CVT24_002540 [Panaeolus cyanescens]|uniref:Nucleoplasmin-like domain-containing protein n=1 Tax=Panaeolus cyanescens TaxID=181874 RepID=A0A409WB03_9AGAR|nr:hypothetical protein CVT24_002540 [Panaeolus cyanescens]
MPSRADDWVYNLHAGHPLTLNPTMPLFITNAALVASVADDNARTCLQLQYLPEGEPNATKVVVASFFKNRCDSKLLSLKLRAGNQYILSIIGPNDIDLIGYYSSDFVEEPIIPLPSNKPKAKPINNEGRVNEAPAVKRTRSRVKADAIDHTASPSYESNPPKKAPGRKPAAATALAKAKPSATPGESLKVAGKRKALPEEEVEYRKPVGGRGQYRHDGDDDEYSDNDN